MLKISHIKIRPIHVILGMFFGVLGACYLPRGAFMANPTMIKKYQNDSLKITVPTEFQPYNYFKMTYVKNKDVYFPQKINDSTLVFLPKILSENRGDLIFLVEAGIIPFSQKR